MNEVTLIYSAFLDTEGHFTITFHTQSSTFSQRTHTAVRRGSQSRTAYSLLEATVNLEDHIVH